MGIEVSAGVDIQMVEQLAQNQFIGTKRMDQSDQKRVEGQTDTIQRSAVQPPPLSTPMGNVGNNVNYKV